MERGCGKVAGEDEVKRRAVTKSASVLPSVGQRGEGAMEDRGRLSIVGELTVGRVCWRAVELRRTIAVITEPASQVTTTAASHY